MINGTLSVTHTPKELEARLNEIEASGLDGKLVRLTDFGAGRFPDGTPANEAQFEEVELRPARTIVIVTGIPDDADAKGGFFSKLQKRGLELITYANIFVRGDDGKPVEIEAVTCRTDEDQSQVTPAGNEASPASAAPLAPASIVPAPTAPSPTAPPAAEQIPQMRRAIPAGNEASPASAAPLAPASIVPAPTAPSATAPPATEQTPQAPVASTSTTPAVAATRPPTSAAISENALQLIFESEGLDQPSAWPGGASGITIGVGYDLGYASDADFVADWSTRLASGAVLHDLRRAIGKKGGAARALASSFRGIRIQRDPAREVFRQRDLPRFRRQTRDAFGANFDELPSDAQGALISLVFNRGPGMNGDSRREMREIRDLIRRFKDGDSMQALLDGIAAAVVAMKRLWRGKGLNGLLVRRDAEAKLIRNARD